MMKAANKTDPFDNQRYDEKSYQFLKSLCNFNI